MKLVSDYFKFHNDVAKEEKEVLGLPTVRDNNSLINTKVLLGIEVEVEHCKSWKDPTFVWAQKERFRLEETIPSRRINRVY